MRPRVAIDASLVSSSGFLATLVMTTVVYLQALAGWAQVDLPTWTARLFTHDAVMVGEVGILLHLFVGFTFAWVFARFVEPRLGLSPIAAGLAYGAVLWLFAQTVAVPTLGALAGTTMSPGWLSMHLGLSSAAASLVAHLAYGSALSVVYGWQWSAADGRPMRGWTEHPVG
jgi:uncharacterized membrane protein YagU involved in acid resistance